MEHQGQPPPYVGRPSEQDYSLAVPLGYTPHWSAPQPSIAILCDLYHAELSDEIFDYLVNVPFSVDLFLSTDNDQKQRHVEQIFAKWNKGEVDVKRMPNRGRDIAPKLVGFRHVYERYEYILHLHANKSSDDKTLASWRGFLLENLIGSPEIVRSIFEAFARNHQLGIVFPQHYEYVRRWLDWNGNYPIARDLAQRMGLRLSPEQTIDFPSGSMFWARSAALRPLLELGLSFQSFPPEEGQNDGTSADAIERLYLFACERAGFTWLKIANPALYTDTSTIIGVDSPTALDRFISQYTVRLTGPNPPARRTEAPPLVELVSPGLLAQLKARERRRNKSFPTHAEA